ncbi:MAG: hypothetical protein CMB99_06155 [Flavobacteriaceae bacterium]|nr:hypothetical protein [Flavobacteriaceae bacterium]|tara:strand:- start:370 stop:585 length:216 start_codon:yes stop_codon:yes gene_type:complete
MSDNYTKVFTESRIIVQRLASLLEEKGIPTLVKSDKLPAYEISNFIDELFVLESDLEKANPIIEDFKSALE